MYPSYYGLNYVIALCHCSASPVWSRLSKNFSYSAQCLPHCFYILNQHLFSLQTLPLSLSVLLLYICFCWKRCCSSSLSKICERTTAGPNSRSSLSRPISLNVCLHIVYLFNTHYAQHFRYHDCAMFIIFKHLIDNHYSKLIPINRI